MGKRNVDTRTSPWKLVRHEEPWEMGARRNPRREDDRKRGSRTKMGGWVSRLQSGSIAWEKKSKLNRIRSTPSITGQRGRVSGRNASGGFILYGQGSGHGES